MHNPVQNIAETHQPISLERDMLIGFQFIIQKLNCLNLRWSSVTLNVS